MFFEPGLGGDCQRPRYRQQPCLPITMPAPIDRNGLEPEIDRRKMSAGGAATLTRDRGGKQPAAAWTSGMSQSPETVRGSVRSVVNGNTA